MMSWSQKRRAIYGVSFLTFIAIVLAWVLFALYYQPPSCYDGERNNGENGIDCGGECQYLCPFQVADPVVLFSRSFEVANSVYNAVAYVENPNFDVAVNSIDYTFKLYNSRNKVIAERSGSTYIAAGKISPIFEGGIQTNGEVPTRTLFTMNNQDKWTKVAPFTKSPIIVKNKTLINTGTYPRLSAVIENTSVTEYKDVEIVAVIFSANKNAIATSRTFVPYLPNKGKVDVDFTWPLPLQSEIEACTIPVDVAMLLDTSGSMNNDGDTPPQPLTDAKDAAVDFVQRLSPDDRASIVTFATYSSLLSSFSSDHETSANTIKDIEILPEEEVGGTNMGAALLDAVTMLNADSESGRNDARKVLILLTDGIANEPIDPGGEPYAISQAQFAKESGYTIYTIGLGEEVNSEFLKNIATKPFSAAEQFYFKAGTSKDLGIVYKEISDSICERGPAIIDVIPRLRDRVVE